MLHSLDHVIVVVRDLEVATRTASLLLGRRPSWRGEHPGAGSANTLFRLDNTYLELLTPAGEGSVASALRAWLAERGEGPLGLAFGTDDAQRCREELAGRGLEPGAVEKGLGRDLDSGAFREWRRVPIPLARTRGVLLFAVEHTTPEALLPAAPLATDAEAAVFALDHAVVRTRDPDLSRALYGEGLGLRLALDRCFEWQARSARSEAQPSGARVAPGRSRGRDPVSGARLLFFRIGGVTVELAARLGAAAEPAASDELWGFSWQVRDAEAARRRLAGAGFDVSEVRPGRRPGTRVLSVRGEPCGVATLLLEAGSLTQDGRL